VARHKNSKWDLECWTDIVAAGRCAGMTGQFKSWFNTQTVVVLKEKQRGILIMDNEANVSQIHFDFPTRQEIFMKIAFRNFNFDQFDHEQLSRSLRPLSHRLQRNAKQQMREFFMRVLDWILRRVFWSFARAG
jgi:hypothetical protein